MKIGVVQLDILWEDKSQNMKKCETFFKEASVSGCDLLIFPELTLIGFTMNTSLAESFESSESVAAFRDYCHRYSVDCIFGYSEKADDDFYNVLLHINKSGEVSSRYRKMHPFLHGGEIYTAGDDFCVCKAAGEDIGLSICYDLRFPELYQQLSKKSKCIVVSANWPESRREHWIALLKARAIENQCFIIGCNRVGKHEEMTYSGDSMVISPDGMVLAAAKDSAENLLCCDIDISEADNLRCSFLLKNDRRNNIYRNFYE